MSAIPVLGKQRQEDLWGFQASQSSCSGEFWAQVRVPASKTKMEHDGGSHLARARDC